MQDRMTAQQTAEYLGLNRETVYRMARRKEIPHFKLGNRILFSKSSIEEWIREQEEANMSASSY
ncbi:helix-turn-helix domain-containing protein [Alkalibacillus almallahensis]|uniref:helix-turn-helix domain-containing protein n=1 Tax=Alkalibacillus almallahensis TaxID=1379154 RepID=UPI001420461F|nr:helix-turn-helix domain-containing protein [Alkalibacillus almallahensis]NIK11159.1 excisionase family DNA binding protein [Alkalibacillus almallahensis]